MTEENLWIRDNWDQGKGRSVAIKLKCALESFQSRYQKIDVYQTECFGKMLMLDDVIMFTEFDEFAYHEMIAHVALHVHPNPKRVLIIGGGDGGALREVLKHDVEGVHLCEIDEEVINVSKQYFPTLTSGFDDSRLRVYYEDGAKFIKDKRGAYDIIVVDSTDPWGPAEVLFEEEFYRDMHDALTNEGIVITQSESMFYDQDTIQNLFDFNKKIYPIVKYYYTLVPTYPSGTIGFSFCSKKYDPVKYLRAIKIDGLKYYNRDVHNAAFALPNFIKEIILI